MEAILRSSSCGPVGRSQGAGAMGRAGGGKGSKRKQPDGNDPELDSDENLSGESGDTDESTIGGSRSHRGSGRKSQKAKPAVPKKAARAKGKAAKAGKEPGRSKRRTGAGLKWCRACQQDLPLDQFAVNQDEQLKTNMNQFSKISFKL